MLNFDFLKGLGRVSPPHFVYAFSRKIFLILCFIERAKFCGSRAIVGLVGFVPSCHRAFVGP